MKYENSWSPSFLVPINPITINCNLGATAERGNASLALGCWGDPFLIIIYLDSLLFSLPVALLFCFCTILPLNQVFNHSQFLLGWWPDKFLLVRIFRENLNFWTVPDSLNVIFTPFLCVFGIVLGALNSGFFNWKLHCVYN